MTDSSKFSKIFISWLFFLILLLFFENAFSLLKLFLLMDDLILESRFVDFSDKIRFSILNIFKSLSEDSKFIPFLSASLLYLEF